MFWKRELEYSCVTSTSPTWITWTWSTTYVQWPHHFHWVFHWNDSSLGPTWIETKSWGYFGCNPFHLSEMLSPSRLFHWSQSSQPYHVIWCNRKEAIGCCSLSFSLSNLVLNEEVFSKERLWEIMVSQTLKAVLSSGTSTENRTKVHGE
jgi:hypothetical protein